MERDPLSKQLFQEYNIENANDIQDALKDLLGSSIRSMMEREMNEYLGYSKSERSSSDEKTVLKRLQNIDKKWTPHYPSVMKRWFDNGGAYRLSLKFRQKPELHFIQPMP